MSKSDNEKVSSLPSLGANRQDRIASTLKAALAITPIVGPSLCEIINELIPGQRIERIEKYLQLLSTELEYRTCCGTNDNLVDLLRKQLKHEHSIDLVEEGAYLSSRALTDERIKYITQCVANGIEADELEKINHKRILNIIGQLDDYEILLLDAFDSPYIDKFSNLRPGPQVVGASPDVIKQYAMYEAAVAKLERLSLVKFNQRTKNIEIPSDRGAAYDTIKVPDVDSFGKPAGYRVITTLGRLVLTDIGLAVSTDI